MSDLGDLTQLDTAVKRAVINRTGSGELLAFVAGKKLRILSLSMQSNTVEITQFDDGDDTLVCGPFANVNTAPLNLGFNALGWFETPSGKSLKLLNTVGAVGGCITYIEV